MSKTIEIRLYQFSELTESAKETAINNARQWVGETQNEIDSDSYEFAKEEMERVLGIKLEIGRYGYHKWEFTDERWEDVCEDSKYLIRYLNWVMDKVDNFKSYWSPFKYSKGNPPKATSRKSRILHNGYDNSLTGDWTDYAFGKMMGEAYDWVRNHKTIDQFVCTLVNKFHDEWDEDMEFGYSDDNVRDILEMNEDTEWYLEDGRKFDGTFAI